MGHAQYFPTPEHPVGFRGDWTGRYPGAEPPFRWSLTENVAWKTEVGTGESSPVVVGNRVFLLTNGIRLSCLDAARGQLLWRKEHHLRQDVPEEVGPWMVEEYVLRHHQMRPVQDRLRSLQDALKTLRNKTERARQPGDAERLVALEKELADCEAQVEIREKDLADFVEKIPVANVSGQQQRLSGGAAKPNALTYAIATPCSDGRRLYAWLPTGVLVCYDLEGNRQWVRVLGKRRASGGWYGGQVAPSPLLADGKLVVHYDQIYCLDAATGKTLFSGIEAMTGQLRFAGRLGPSARRRDVPACGGEVYPGLTLAGPYLFASGSRGVTAVIKPGGEDGFTIVAVNHLESFGGNMLVFSGRRMFAHVAAMLYCMCE
ncbi:MAG: PQQ-binding-like beta-propeller repeat protein [Thermoguttaceae bacterium]